MSVRDRFPAWFSKKVDEVAKISANITMKRELAFYGAEEEMISPEEAINKGDAEKAVRDAGKVFALCNRMQKAYK